MSNTWPILATSPDLLCLSHLRWDFVFQRPQHLLTRAARNRRVFFVEEPMHAPGIAPRLELMPRDGNVIVVRPHLPEGLTEVAANAALARLVDGLVEGQKLRNYVSWYYTPMALKFTRHLRPVGVVYDCMDQLSHFKNAPKELISLEAELFKTADVVFTGGQSLYEDKRSKHHNVHPFPSSVDVKHFSKARQDLPDPHDFAASGPKIGFIGVIDERFDIPLVAGIAAARPDWQLVMVGPVVKIDPASLPRSPNVHYVGGKSYDELPTYLAHWDLAVLPFARNDSTRYISPTKTPEYLAAGLRVVSTSIRDVVRPYGELGLVAIADEPSAFVREAAALMADQNGYAGWLRRADAHLSKLSWDDTFERMWHHVERAVQDRSDARTSPVKPRHVNVPSSSRGTAAAASASL